MPLHDRDERQPRHPAARPGDGRQVRALLAAAVLTAGVVLGAGAAAQTMEMPDLLSWFSPPRRAAIESGQAIVEIIPRKDVDLAVAGAVRTSADAGRLVAWFQSVEQLQRGKYVPLIERFSEPPRLSDLDTLVLDREEIDALRSCRPGRCEVKLAASEIEHVRQAIAGAGRDWRPAALHAFKEVMLERARVHLAHGFPGARPYEDQGSPVSAGMELDRLLAGCAAPGSDTPLLSAYLRAYPAVRGAASESFLYWSKDTLGDAKPIVGITQISIFKADAPEDPAIVVATQVYATHYLTASTSLTAFVRGPAGHAYLVYSRCVRADVFDGPFGGIVRRLVRKRIRSEGPPLLHGLRRKLEGEGPPPRTAR